MKKSTIILAAVVVATFANAQITLQHTFSNEINLGWGISSSVAFALEADNYIVGNYIFEEQNNNILIYDASDCTLLQTFAKQDGETYAFISKGIFTTDNKWSFVVFARANTAERVDIPYEPCSYYYGAQVKTEDGNILATLTTKVICENQVKLIKVGENYKLVVENDNGKYDYYSLPGNGEATDVDEVSAPRHNNTRKYINNAQVLIDNNERTYTMHGVEVR